MGQSGSRDKSVIIEGLQNIVSESLLKSMNTCDQSSVIDQRVSMYCNPDLTNIVTHDNVPVTVYEENQACHRCMNSVFSSLKSRHVLEQELWTPTDPARVRLPIDDEYQLLLDSLEACGISTCKACSLVNVTQNSISRAGPQTCRYQIVNDTRIDANLNAAITQSLLRYRDLLSGVTRALAGDDLTLISTRISTQLRSSITDEFISTVNARLTSSQYLTMESSTATYVNGVTQYNALTLILQQVVDSNIVLQSINEAFIDYVARVADEQRGLDDLGKLIFASSLKAVTVLDTIVGQVLIFSLGALGVLVFVVLAFILYKSFTRAWDSFRGPSPDRQAVVDTLTVGEGEIGNVEMASSSIA